MRLCSWPASAVHMSAISGSWWEHLRNCASHEVWRIPMSKIYSPRTSVVQVQWMKKPTCWLRKRPYRYYLIFLNPLNKFFPSRNYRNYRCDVSSAARSGGLVQVRMYQVYHAAAGPVLSRLWPSKPRRAFAQTASPWVCPRTTAGTAPQVAVSTRFSEAEAWTFVWGVVREFASTWTTSKSTQLNPRATAAAVVAASMIAMWRIEATFLYEV